MELENIKLMLDVTERYALNTLTTAFNQQGLSLDQAISAQAADDVLTVYHQNGHFQLEAPNARRCQQVLSIVRGWDLA